MNFYDKVKEICEKNNKVALFVDMDGTIVEYEVLGDNYYKNEIKGVFLNAQPLKIVISTLYNLSKIENLDIYILSLSRSIMITEEKKQWLKNNAPFINEENYIIICRETGEYNSENRDYIKSSKMKERLKEYDYVVLLDDDHKILRKSKKELGGKGTVFHVSSVIT